MTSSRVRRDPAPKADARATWVAVAVVSRNKDDSGQGRVKVSYPWHDHPKDSHWARVAMPMTGKGRGTYFLPEVGDEVLVAFERGDLRFPYVVGSLWNDRAKSPVDNADGKNDLRVIHSRTGHKLIFDDGVEGKVQLELNDGKRMTIDHGALVLDDAKGNRIALTSGGVTINATKTLTLRAAQIVIESTGTTSIKAVSTLQLAGATITIN